jgi:predicted nucleic acid-binding Zn ribbon protein
MFLVIPLRGALVSKERNVDLMMPDFKWRVLGSVLTDRWRHGQSCMWRHELDDPFGEIVGTETIRRNGNRLPHTLTSSAFLLDVSKNLENRLMMMIWVEATERSSSHMILIVAICKNPSDRDERLSTYACVWILPAQEQRRKSEQVKYLFLMFILYYILQYNMIK